MEETKLISMKAFVLEQKGTKGDSFISQTNEVLTRIFNYANFLNQKLELWMFVPCIKNDNGEWVILEEPDMGNSHPVEMETKGFIFQEAKSRVLFEGFEFIYIDRMLTGIGKNIHKDNKEKENYIYAMWKKDGEDWYPSVGLKSIEDLVDFQLTLTPTAKEQIGLN